MSDPISNRAFEEPWEARALAISIALREVGLVDETDWSAALGAAIRQAQAAGDPDTGETYYRHVLAALERIVSDKGLAAPAELAKHRLALSTATAEYHHPAKAPDPADAEGR